jgi:hypothetical protein
MTAFQAMTIERTHTTAWVVSVVAVACSGHAEKEPSPLVTSMFEGARVPANLPLEDAQIHRNELCDAFQANLGELVTTEEAIKSCGAEALVGALLFGSSEAEAVLACEAAIDECASSAEVVSRYYQRCPKNVVEGADGCRATVQAFAECEEAHFRRQKAALQYSCAEALTIEGGGVPDACRNGRLPCGDFLSFVTWPITGTDFPDGG